MIWEVIVFLTHDYFYFAPYAHEIVIYFIQKFNLVMFNYLYTLFTTIISICLAALLSLVIFYWSVEKTIIRKKALNFLLIFQTVPLTVIAPLLIIWFGFSVVPKILVVTLFGTFPILLNIDRSFDKIPEEMYELFELVNTKKKDVFRHLIIPSILPSFFSGLKLTVSYGFASMIMTEFIGGQYGLGIYLSRALSSYDNEAIFLIVILSVITTFMLTSLVKFVETKVYKKFYKGLLYEKS